MAERGEWKQMAAGIGALAVVTVIVGFGGSQLALRFYDGSYVGALASSDSIIVGEAYTWGAVGDGEGSMGGKRLSRIDLASGQETARRSLSGLRASALHDKRELVCDANGIVVLDRYSLKTTSPDWYSSSGPLGEPFDDMPKVRRANEEIFAQSRSGAWFMLQSSTSLLPTAEPHGSDYLEWPTARGARARADIPGLVSVHRYNAPDWLVEHAGSLDPDDGRRLSTIDNGIVRELLVLESPAQVMQVFAHENDAIVVFAGDGVEVVRLSRSAGVVWQHHL